MKSIEQVKGENGIGSEDFLGWLMFNQLVFELIRQGTDGTLREHNSVEHGLTRGVIGEAHEALEALQELEQAERETPEDYERIEALRHHLKVEISDVLIFLGSVLSHAGMSLEEVIEIVAGKIEQNKQKYHPDNFYGHTVEEALIFSREEWNKKHEADNQVL